MYRAHAPLVRCVLLRFEDEIQEADRKDIEQDLWTKLVTSWPTDPPPDNDEAYLTGAVKHAVADFYRRKHRQKRDERKNVSLAVEEAPGPVDSNLVDPCDVPVDFERVRTSKRVRVIAQRLAPREREIFGRMIVDFDGVPAKQRNRVIAAMRDLMEVASTPRGFDDTDDIDGPSHCGRTVRRLGLNEEDIADAWPDAAE